MTNKIYSILDCVLRGKTKEANLLKEFDGVIWKLIVLQKIYFIVISNAFATDHHIDLRYDLKGSKIERKVLTGTTNETKLKFFQRMIWL